MNNVYLPSISEEQLAAWLDGNVTPEQDAYISQMCAVDPSLRDIMDANDDVESTYDDLVENGFELPYEFCVDFVLPEIEDTYSEILPYEQDEEYALHEVDSHEEINDEVTDETPIDVSSDYFDV